MLYMNDHLTILFRQSLIHVDREYNITVNLDKGFNIGKYINIFISDSETNWTHTLHKWLFDGHEQSLCSYVDRKSKMGAIKRLIIKKHVNMFLLQVIELIVSNVLRNDSWKILYKVCVFMSIWNQDGLYIDTVSKSPGSIGCLFVLT